MKKLLCAIALSAAVLLGADVTGKWSGTAVMARDGETHDQSAYFVLKQEGSAITGTAGPSEGDQHPLKDGRIEGNDITFEVEHEGASNVRVRLKVDGDDHMTGEATGETDEGQFRVKLDMKREK